MMSTEEFYQVDSGSGREGNMRETYRSDSSLNTQSLMQGFTEHATLRQSQSPQSDFFQRDDMSSLDSASPQYSKPAYHSTQNHESSNYFNPSDGDSTSPVETPHRDYSSQIEWQKVKNSASDFFKVDESLSELSQPVDKVIDSQKQIGHSDQSASRSPSSGFLANESTVSPNTLGEGTPVSDTFGNMSTVSSQSNFFQPNDIDETSRSARTPAFTDRSEMSDGDLEEMTDVELTAQGLQHSQALQYSQGLQHSQALQHSQVLQHSRALTDKTLLDSDSDSDLTDRLEPTQSADVRQSKLMDDLESELSLLEKPEKFEDKTVNKSRLIDSDDSDDFTERSGVIDDLQRSQITSSESGWSTIETPKSNFFKAEDKSSGVTEFSISERSDVTLTTGRDAFEPAKRVTHKPNVYESDVARKYNSFQKQRENAHGSEFKSNFVNEMLVRAQEKQSRQTPSPMDRPTSASKYPKGIVLSKTFTKNTHKTFQAWASNGHSNKDGARNDDDFSVVSATPPLISPPAVASAPQWKNHEPNGYERQMRNGNHDNVSPSNSERSSSRSKMLQSPGVVNESYYQSILQTTPLSHPNTPASTQRSAAERSTKKTDTKRPQSRTDFRPASAQKSRSNQGESKTKAHADNNGGFTVIGKKQDVGPKRTKSTHGRYRSDHKPSYVDELLFGKQVIEPDFPSPFGDTNSNAKPLPYVAIASIEPPNQQQVNKKHSSTCTKSSNQATRTSSGDTQTSKHRGKQYFSNTYVDEGLFGPKPDEPSFKAPWDKGDCKKPYVFDGTNHKAGKVIVNRRESAQNAVKKPVWR